MSISELSRNQVRERASYACEYCGVTETDSAGQLTVDHFQPQSLDGSNALDNLIYCCNRCNQYKADYWPQDATAPTLWNPRQQSSSTHFVELADGRLFALTDVGRFSLRRLNLNRPPLNAYRLQRRQRAEEQRLLTQYKDSVRLLQQLRGQEAELITEQRALLEEQRNALKILLNCLEER